MKTFVLLAMLSIALAGCAGERRGIPLASLEPAPREAIIALNVPTGSYMYFDTLYGNGTVELSVRSPKADPQWAAMNGLCIRAASEGDQVCLKFYLENRERNEISGVKEVLGDGRKTLRSREKLEGIFHIGDAIKVDMQADGNDMRFSINGAQPVLYSLSGKPAFISLLCSTATCAMRL